MTESTVISTPRGLGARGKRLWKDVTTAYKLRPDEVVVLENACRSLDRALLLDKELEGQPLMVSGSQGQKREHPLLVEQRQQWAMVNKSLAQLRLPDEVDAKVNQQRTAAMSRWAQAHGGTS